MDDDTKLPHQMMANRIKALVSKEKNRYKEGGYDLDLTYINNNIIAMGYPAEKLEGVYRNNIDDVVRFLEEKHKDHYRVYNLCAERSYDTTKFHNRVVTFPLEDHNPPGIELFEPFCLDMDEWLSRDSENIAVVHCKAGKGRTGVMICAYLLHSGEYSSYEEALSFYGEKRTKNHKGVTIPSQRRYVQYFGFLKQSGRSYKQVTLILKSVEFSSTPNYNNSGSCTQLFVVNRSLSNTADTVCHQNSHGEQKWSRNNQAESRVKMYASQVYEFKRGVKPPVMYLNPPTPVCGDVQIEFYHKSKVMKKERMCHFWFNTFFVSQDISSERRCSDGSEAAVNLVHEVVTTETRENAYGEIERIIRYVVPKCEIDKALKDTSQKIFSNDFTVTLEFMVPLEEHEPPLQRPAQCKSHKARRSPHLVPPLSGHPCVSDSEPEPPSEEERESESDLEWTEEDKVAV